MSPASPGSSRGGLGRTVPAMRERDRRLQGLPAQVRHILAAASVAWQAEQPEEPGAEHEEGHWHDHGDFDYYVP